MDLKNIISKKTHDSSIEKLKDVPPSLKEQLSHEFIASVASALSSITHDTFNYTGKIVKESNTIRITFTSASEADSVDLLVNYQDAGYKFVNINDKLEKALDNKETETIMPSQEEPIDQSDKKIDVVKIDHTLLNALTTKIEKDQEEEKEEKKRKVNDMLMGALNTLEVREEFKKKEQLLDLLLKEEGND
jgi:hypothetical protein